MDSFGERLRKARKKTGLNQDDFATVGGVMRNAQMNYERGVRLPDAEYLQALAKYGIDVLFLLIGEKPEEVETTRSTGENSLVENYRSANGEGRNAMVRICKTLREQFPADIATPPTPEKDSDIDHVADYVGNRPARSLTPKVPEDVSIKSVKPRVKKTIKMADVKQVASGPGSSIQVGRAVQNSTVFNGGIDGNSVADGKRATPTSGARRKRG